MALVTIGNTLLSVPTGIASNSTVSLNRGSTYVGTLNLAGLSNVIVQAVGTGAFPVVTTGAAVSGWSLHSGNIYKAAFSNFTPVELTIEGSPVALSHYPSSAGTFLTSGAGSDNNHLNYTLPAGASGNMAGAGAVVHTANWMYYERTTTGYSGGVISLVSDANYDAQGTSQKNFYLEGRLWMLGEANSWCYEGGVVYLWCPDGAAPGSRKVWATPATNCVDVSSSSGCNVSGIATLGGLNGIYAGNATSLTAQNCNISSALMDGVWGGGTFGIIIDNCKIYDSGRNNIDTWYGPTKVTITNNDCRNSGIVAGVPKPAIGSIFVGTGSNDNSSYTNLVRGNTCINSCYVGIHVASCFNTTVDTNTVDGACVALDDGGGIYTGSPQQKPLNMVISNNTVKNVFTAAGWGGRGIYLDDSSNGVTITGNTISDADILLYLHNAFNCTITNNHFIANVSATSYVATLLADLGDSAMHNNVFTGNTVTCATNATKLFDVFPSGASHKNYISPNNNAYYVPYAATDAYFADSNDGTGTTFYSFNTWKNYIGADGASTFNVALPPSPSPSPLGPLWSFPRDPSTLVGVMPFGDTTGLYQLAISDEFNGAVVNSNLWQDHMWYTTSDPVYNYDSNGAGNGALRLWPDRTTFTRRDIGSDPVFTTGFGYYEIRAILPIGIGVNCSLTLIDHRAAAMPSIDLMSAFPGGGTASGYGNANYHPIAYKMDAYLDVQTGVLKGAFTYNPGFDLSIGYNRFGCKIDPNFITYYFNGVSVYSIPNPFQNTVQFSSILTLGYGGLSGTPGAGTPTGSTNSFTIDYYRMWNLLAAPEPKQATSGSSYNTTFNIFRNIRYR